MGNKKLHCIFESKDKHILTRSKNETMIPG